jgi:hypothetical protein
MSFAVPAAPNASARSSRTAQRIRERVIGNAMDWPCRMDGKEGSGPLDLEDDRFEAWTLAAALDHL